MQHNETASHVIQNLIVNIPSRSARSQKYLPEYAQTRTCLIVLESSLLHSTLFRQLAVFLFLVLVFFLIGLTGSLNKDLKSRAVK